MKNRNGLLDLYRIFFCFWAMYYHDFFFFKDNGTFSLAQLTVDFFFILSGFFLIRSMRKHKDGSVWVGAKELLFSRIRPMFFTLCFIVSFNAVCMLLFVREGPFEVLFEIFCYWWYVLYLMLAIGLIYLLYRLVKNEKLFGVLLVVIAIAMGVFHYFLEEREFFIYEFTYVARTFGCLSIGMLISYIPRWKMKKFNVSILIVVLLIPTVLYFAYGEKVYLTRILMILLFAALVYFTSNISVEGKFFNFLGQLSMRMYLYMSFVSMLRVLGLTEHRVLFVVDLSLAVMDLMLSYYRKKYQALKAKAVA